MKNIAAGFLFIVGIILAAGCGYKAPTPSTTTPLPAPNNQATNTVLPSVENPAVTDPAPVITVNSPVVIKGSQVKVTYVGTLADGSEFDSTEKHGGTPLEFTVGAGQMIPGFDKAVVGMHLNEEKKFTIPTAEAYGPRRDEMIREVPRNQLPPDIKPEVGLVLGVKGPNGQGMPATIVAVTDAAIKLDMNHPLAGKDLTFTVKLVGIN